MENSIGLEHFYYVLHFTLFWSEKWSGEGNVFTTLFTKTTKLKKLYINKVETMILLIYRVINLQTDYLKILLLKNILFHDIIYLLNFIDLYFIYFKYIP